jgi:membrane fusion protein (multidrug efflux system)
MVARVNLARGILRRHPVASVVGSVLLTTTAGLGYLYLDHAWRFQTADDAFIAARQFSIASQVPGYITAVPVTDNQHDAAGGIIARSTIATIA